MPYVTEKIAKITVNPIKLRPKRLVKKDSILMHKNAAWCCYATINNNYPIPPLSGNKLFIFATFP